MDTEHQEHPQRKTTQLPRQYLVVAILVLILFIGAYFRFVGINWDDDQHLHPDERFMTMVAEKISSVDDLGQYFDTDNSTLNPLSHGFYTYGMLPLFLTRYVSEWLARTEYDQVVLVGRALSGLFDLAAIGLLYLLGARLYGRWVALLAAALYAATVLAIQLSHFFTVDSFTTVFLLLALYAAALVMEKPRWWAFALFGLSTGLAMTTKVSIAPLAGIIAVAGLAYLVTIWPQQEKRVDGVVRVVIGIILAGLYAAIIFRIFQPYAFKGPSFFDAQLNPRWLEIIRGVTDQVAGRVDFPPDLHWANRPWSYGWTNMVRWGMGLPLGLMATFGWAWAAWRCLHGDWRRHLLPVIWVGGFFLWQNMNFWRYTRYFLPIYPLAILLAAWSLLELFNRARAARRQRFNREDNQRKGKLLLGMAGLLLVGVLVATYGYAFAFTNIYKRPHTRVVASEWMQQNIPGPVNVMIDTAEGRTQVPLPIPDNHQLIPGQEWTASFTSATNGTFTSVMMPHLIPTRSGRSQTTLTVNLTEVGSTAEPLGTVVETVRFDEKSDPRGEALEFTFPRTALSAGQEYLLTVAAIGGSAVTLSGANVAVETSWDDVLPLITENYIAYGGLYNQLNLELFEPDDEVKRKRILEFLEQADYLTISSNRAFDAMPRLPLRYPLTTAYYEALFDCDVQQITSCANPAAPPLQSALGFDLVATFESYPNLGPIRLPDQSAQESFTVYDHPKVFIYQKSPEFSIEQIRTLLDEVDLTQVVEQSARQYTQSPTGLRLAASQSLLQKAKGTWGQIISTTSALNQSQFLGTVGWYLLLAILGWVAFPLVFVAFRGLPDHGYGLARLVGLLVVAWLAWLGGSIKVLPFSRGTLLLAIVLLLAVSGILAWKYRETLKTFVRTRWRLILFIEVLFLSLFLFNLIIRLNNPDLWHPWRGGEKPGDFALFNAILKTVHFPPYDPWLSGHFVNYYYYGYVLGAVPTKLLGIIPSVAYNLLLPTWYALTGVGVFTVAFAIASPRKQTSGDIQSSGSGRGPYLAGIVAVAVTILLGNLYEARILWDRLPGFAPTTVENPSILQQTSDAIAGLRQVISGQADMFVGDNGLWYFDASRAILNGQAEAPITEFPFFTFLYGDLHPHLLDMPIVLAALAWIVSILRIPAIVSKPFQLKDALITGATWLVAGLVFGATYPTNTWDFPIVIVLCIIAIGYAVWSARESSTEEAIKRMLLRMALLVVVSFGLYTPFRQWLGTGDLSFELWQGPRTPLGDFVTVYGLFLFLILTFLVLETIRWLRPKINEVIHTQLGELATAMKVGLLLLMGVLLFIFVGLPWSFRNDYQSVVLALLIASWAGTLLLRRDQTVGERIILSLIAVGFGLTIIAELFTIKGDVGRMNVVFKLYIVVWMFFGIAFGVLLLRVWKELQGWNWRWFWLLVLELLLIAAIAYPIVGTLAKIDDRWPGVTNPPQTLDGMSFMDGGNLEGGEGTTSAIYYEDEQPLYLGRDYAAIRWMQENIRGTPTIVEAHSPEYRWGSRYAVYTGLPTIVGWSWHLRQRNVVLPPSVVEKRIEDVHQFYNTPDEAWAVEFLDRYRVDYIVVGDLERVQYSPEGLEKFKRMVANGDLSIVYPESAGAESVTIYAVQSF